MKSEITTVQQYEKEWDDFRNLLKRRPWVALIIVFIFVLPSIYAAYVHYKNSELTSTLEDMKSENTKLELRLAPFLAVANKSFPESVPDKRLDMLFEKLNETLTTVKEVAQTVSVKRCIDPASKELLIRNLKAIHPLNVELYCLLNDAEGFSLAMQIKSIFSEGGWKASAINQLTYYQDMKSIALVFGKTPSKELRTGLLPLFDSLGAPREARVADPGTDINADTLRIIIGPKLEI